MASSKCLSRQLLKTFWPSCAPQNAFISDSLQQDRDVWANAIKDSHCGASRFPKRQGWSGCWSPLALSTAFWHTLHSLAPPGWELVWGCRRSTRGPSFCRILYTKPDEQRRRRLTSNKCCTVSFSWSQRGQAYGRTFTHQWCIDATKNTVTLTKSMPCQDSKLLQVFSKIFLEKTANSILGTLASVITDKQ